MADELFFTVNELAGYLRIRPITVYKHVETGKLPGFKVGSKWRFRKSAIDKWIDTKSNNKKQVRKISKKPVRTPTQKITAQSQIPALQIIAKPEEDKRRVVVTGIGIVSPIGIGKNTFWDNCLLGVSGVKPITSFDTEGYRTKIAATIDDFKPEMFLDEKLIARTDRFAHLAITATKMALKDSGLTISKDISNKTGVFLGVGLGGMFFYEKQIEIIMKRGAERTHPLSIPKIMPNAVANDIAILFSAKGPNMTISTACSSSTHSIGLAYDSIKKNRADIIIAGGTEAPIIKYNFAAFDAMKVMSKNNENSKEASRPFDKDRDGFVMGEGAAILILESLEHAKKRGADIYTEIIGYSATSGAYHFVAPQPDGADIIRTMEVCIKEAKLTLGKIDYINAHGTSTIANDTAETIAIKNVFREHAYKIPVNSTKSMIGHTLGAAGAFEAAVCALSIKTSRVHPTANLKNPDKECDLDYVIGKYRKKKINYALSNSFAFGNNNACLVFASYK